MSWTSQNAESFFQSQILGVLHPVVQPIDGLLQSIGVSVDPTILSALLVLIIVGLLVSGISSYPLCSELVSRSKFSIFCRHSISSASARFHASVQRIYCSFCWTIWCWKDCNVLSSALLASRVLPAPPLTNSVPCRAFPRSSTPLLSLPLLHQCDQTKPQSVSAKCVGNSALCRFSTLSDSNQTAQSKKSIKIVDFPGHRRVREDLLTALPTSGALVFVVDAVTIRSDIRPVAQFLYDLFTNQIVNKAALPVLVACNKQDIVTASRPAEVRSLLEKELDQLRSTRSSTPVQEGTQRGEEVFLGIEGEAFKLEHLPMEVTFVDSSAKEDELDEVKQWLVKQL